MAEGLISSYEDTILLQILQLFAGELVSGQISSEYVYAHHAYRYLSLLPHTGQQKLVVPVASSSVPLTSTANHEIIFEHSGSRTFIGTASTSRIAAHRHALIQFEKLAADIIDIYIIDQTL